MHCPRCLADDGDRSRTKVLETRPERLDQHGAGVRRRRECTICGHRFTTSERPKAVSVRNGDGTVVAFDEGRLLRSLQRSSTGSEVKDGELREAADNVRWDIERHRGPVTPANIARLALGRLPSYRSGARDLYRKRTPSLGTADSDEVLAGVVEKSWSRSEPIYYADERTLEPFDRRKLRASVMHVADRRIDDKAIESLVNKVESWVMAEDGPVSTGRIRRRVANLLRPLDSLVYLRVLAAAPDAEPELLERAVKEIQHGLLQKRRDQGFEHFSRSKLIVAIERATAGRDAVSADDIREFVDEIAGRVRAGAEPVKSEQIGRWVLAWLRQRDPAAFIAFLALQPQESESDLAKTLRGEFSWETS